MALIKKDFIIFSDTRPRRKERRFILLTRTLIFFLILIAMASPFSLESTTIQGDPFVKILVDNSTSFSLFDQNVGPNLKEQLENYVEVEYKQFGEENRTALGDALLRNMERDESILLITDGNNNYGSALGDIGLYAKRINATLNVVNLKPKKDDSSIKVVGPTKISADVESTYTIILDGTTTRNILVEVDGEKAYEGQVRDSVTISKSFSSGYHKITARILDKDHFSQNNVYYKTIKVVEKPKIGFYSDKDSPMKVILDELYVTNKLDFLSNYQSMHAVVINDIHADNLASSVSSLGDYISEGNGLLVVGGQTSLDKGFYKGSLIESLLPSFVSGAKEDEGEKMNVVIAIDISTSTSEAFGQDSASDVEKALALSALSNIGDNSNVGVIGFNTKVYTVSDLSPLGQKRAELESKIKAIQDLGNTYVPVGVAKAIEMLENVPGNKNLILISDGKSGGSQATTNYVKLADEKGIKVIFISVEETPISKHECGSEHAVGYGAQLLYNAIADSCVESALFFKGLESPQKINVLFGDSSGKKPAGSDFLVVVLNDNHFITSDLELSASVTGFNQVIPKSTAQLLITTDTGEPLLTVWRYGLGRVALLSTDDGSKWAGELLNKKNSKLITRTMNWVIGDPERNLDRFVDIQDTRVGEGVEITVKEDKQPAADGVAFYKFGEDLYKGTIEIDATGFHSLIGATFAVNYPKEYEGVSLNEQLTSIVQSTGGLMFEENDLEGMVNAIRSQSRRTLDDRKYFRWPFILAAIVILLFEICVRRIAENKRWSRQRQY